MSGARGPGGAPVLMIGLDAADARLVERWGADGSLPRLTGLRAQGAYGRLRPPDDVLVGLPWPSFFTGAPVSDHGLYKYLIWSPERMTEIRPRPEVLPLEPFWRRLGSDPRVVAMDVPLVYAPEPFPGVEVAGWATHERLTGPGTHPAELAGRIEARFGPAPFFDEAHHRVDLGRLLEERDALIDATDQASGLAAHLLESEPWELGVVCFSATHRAGHKLWSEAGSTGVGTAEERASFAGALREVYVAVDRAVGRLLDLVGPDTTVVAFALHGMGPNGSLVDLLPDMVRAVLGDEGGPATPGSWLDRVRDAVPLAWRDEAKRRLPVSVRDRLSAFWRTARLDWSSTRAFCLAADLHGYIRLNVRGREAAGIVEPGDEYDELCRRLAGGLRSFLDVQTGEPVVKRVLRRDEAFPHGRRAEQLPDLIVVWDDRPAAERDEIRSARFGSVRWPTPGAYPDGRSGNHRPEGFAVIRGPAFEPGSALPDAATVLDLAPTALDLLGIEPMPGMRGRPWSGRAAVGR